MPVTIGAVEGNSGDELAQPQRAKRDRATNPR